MHEEFLASLNADNICKVETMFYILDVEDSTARQNLKVDVKNLARNFGQSRAYDASLKAAVHERAKRNRGPATGKTTKFTDQPVQLVCGDWDCDDLGVRAAFITRNGEDYEFKYACSVPIMPVELLYNADTATERVRLAYAIRGEWRYITVDRLTVASSTRIVELANAGVEVTSENSKLLVRYISDVIALNELPRITATSKLGWHDDQFIPYSDTVRLDNERQYWQIFGSINQAGSRDKWVEYMVPLLNYNIPFRLTMAAGLASPIISRVNALPFIWHLWGGTGSGKSVATVCAMSVWGDPLIGKLTQSMNKTMNNIMSIAGFLNSIPFGADELQTIKKQGATYDSLVMNLTEGVDRGRMTFNRVDELKTWCCSFLFTGEEPITKQSSGGGVINRVMETQCTDQKIIARPGNEIVEFVSKNHGHIGREWINILNQYGPELNRLYTRAFTKMLEIAPDTTEKKAQSAALVWMADCIAAQEIFHIPILAPQEMLPFLKTSDEVSIAERAHTFVLDAIAENAGKFMDEQNTPRGEVWGRISMGEEVMFNKSVLCRLLEDNMFNFDAVKGEWARKGYINLNPQGRYTHSTKVCGVKANYVSLTLN